MIRKLLLTLAIFISGTILLNAQCTNIIYTSSGLHPDSLRHADATIPYYDTLTVIVPVDTTINYAGTPILVQIDSIALISITGLPSGFVYLINHHNWNHISPGCIFISGTPTHANALTQSGIYPIIINMKGYFTSPIGSANYQLPAYTNDTLKIRNNTYGLTNIDKSKFDVFQNSPNPFSKNTTIVFTSPNSEKYNFTVLNVIGEKVFEKVVNASMGENKIDFSAGELPSGIYMYKLGNNEQAITKRMIITGN